MEMGDPTQRRSLIERYVESEPTAIAHREGFTACRVAISDLVWNRIEQEEGSAAEWLSLVFESLRRSLVASAGLPHADAFRKRVVYGTPEPKSKLEPEAIFAFHAAAKAGRRGVSDDGNFAAIDVPRRDGTTRTVLLNAYPPRGGRVHLLLFFSEFIDVPRGLAARRAN